MNQIENIIFDIAEALRGPVLVLALLSLAAVLVELGSFTVELVRRRRRDFGRLETASVDARSALERGDPTGAKTALRPVAWSTGMARTLAFMVDQWGRAETGDRVAKGLADFDFKSLKRLERTRLLVRAGPALGLMGTLIPLSPALEGLATGNTEELTDNLRIAFSVTVLGLLIGAVAFAISLVRDRLYGQDLSDLEFVAATLVPDIDLDSNAAARAPRPSVARPAGVAAGPDGAAAAPAGTAGAGAGDGVAGTAGVAGAAGAAGAATAGSSGPGAGPAAAPPPRPSAAAIDKPPPPAHAKPLGSDLPPPGGPSAGPTPAKPAPLPGSPAAPPLPGSPAAPPLPGSTAAPDTAPTSSLPATPPAADSPRPATPPAGDTPRPAPLPGSPLGAAPAPPAPAPGSPPPSPPAPGAAHFAPIPPPPGTPGGPGENHGPNHGTGSAPHPPPIPEPSPAPGERPTQAQNYPPPPPRENG